MKKIDRIIGISFILFGIIYIIKIYFYTGLTSTKSIESQILLIKILEVIFLTISLSSLIISGVKKIEYKKIKTWIRPFIGTVIILLLFFIKLSLENGLESNLSSSFGSFNFGSYYKNNTAKFEMIEDVQYIYNEIIRLQKEKLYK